MITVRIGRDEHNLEQVLEAPADYARALDRAKTQLGYVECGCRMASPRPKLVIRRHGKIFILARWPDDPRPHRDGCPFHDRTSRGNVAATDHDAFKTAGGVHDVRLDVSLKVAATFPREVRSWNGQPSRCGCGSSGQRARMKILP